MASERRLQPDIHYQPDIQKYEERTKQRLQCETLATSLPTGYPEQLSSPLAWTNADLNGEEWVTCLTREDQSEIKSALKHFQDLKLNHGQICRETFPLPDLGPRLRALSEEVHCGRGFVILRNFPVNDFNREECVLAYAGVSSYVASLRGLSDHTGAVMVHITDLNRRHQVGTPAYTNDKQGFHTDNGDIVSLLALSVAEDGGASKLASSWHVYNILARSRPDLIRTMSEDWPCDNFGREPAYYMRPIMFYTSERRLVMQFFRRSYTGFGALPRPETIPPITEGQAEALDALEFISQKHSISMYLQRGDIQYINNLSIFHARDAYTDSESNQRHLLRLWLRDDEYGWEIPSKLQVGPGRSWDALRHSARADYHRFPLFPEVKAE